MFYLIFFALAIGAGATMFLTRFYKSERPIVDKLAKVAVVVWMCLYFLNLFLPDGLVLRSYSDITPFASGENIWFVLLRWCNDVAFLVLPVAIFFKKKPFVMITGFFLSFVCLANVAVYFKYIQYFVSPAGAGIAEIRFFSQGFKDFLRNATFRSIYFGLMMFMELMIILFVVLRNLDTFKQRVRFLDVLKGFGILALLFFSIMPIYAPQYIFKGYSDVGGTNFDNFKMGTPFHLIWIAVVVIEGIALTLMFRKKSHEDKYIVVLMLALSLVMQYHQMFTCVGEITTHRMPFQLCNMAGFFILLMLLTKSERIYHFTLVINAVGALIAMALCDTTDYGIAYVMNIHYVVEHTNVILAPILCLTLGVFPRLKVKHIFDFLIGFAIYFGFVWLIGSTFTGIKNLGGPNADYWNCNYLFMLNKEETANILGFVAPLFDIGFKLFNFFPVRLIQLVIFVAFSIICTGAFFFILLLSFLFPLIEKDIYTFVCWTVKETKKEIKDEGDYKGNKIAFAIMCIIFNHVGVPNFMEGETSKGVKKIILVIISCALSLPTLGLSSVFIVIPQVRGILRGVKILNAKKQTVAVAEGDSNDTDQE